jgi:hypothetical protein
MIKTACSSGIPHLSKICAEASDKYEFVQGAVSNGYTFEEIGNWLCVPSYKVAGWYWHKMKKAKQ